MGEREADAVRRPLIIVSAVALLATGCTRPAESESALPSDVPSTASVTLPAPTTVPISTEPTTTQSTPATVPLQTAPPTQPATAPTTELPATPPATTVATAPPSPGETPYRIPVADVAAAGWSPEHHDYPATDIFVGCGADIVSPVDGTMLEVRRENLYDAATDNPALRGGKSLTILGDDGVRYYLAHFDSITEPLQPGDHIESGRYLGTMGMTGRAGACHVHFAISPPCPGKEWSVRRGVVWPYRYLDDWKSGGQASPVDAVNQWSSDNPDTCAEAMSDQFAADA